VVADRGGSGVSGLTNLFGALCCCFGEADDGADGVLGWCWGGHVVV